MKKIGVITSGGDAPGMNAAIRAVVRTAIHYGVEIVGIKRGWKGLIEEDIVPLNSLSVSGIINCGGTILHSVRCPEFKEKIYQKKAVEVLKKNNIEGLVVIGGDGSFSAAKILSKKWNFPTVAIPATIDNDIGGCDFSIGFDTAVNTALEAIDRIRDTAFSHERVFVVEVMGRGAGHLALEAGIAGGADIIIIPEICYDLKKICKKIKLGHKRGKRSWIVVVAEACNGVEVSETIRKETNLEVRLSILGHMQRGGSPTAFSRVLASRLGIEAVKVLLKGEYPKMVGIVGNEVKVFDIDYAFKYRKKIDLKLYKLSEIIS
jgi:6-phosphofructokinase 1